MPYIHSLHTLQPYNRIFSDETVVTIYNDDFILIIQCLLRNTVQCVTRMVLPFDKKSYEKTTFIRFKHRAEPDQDYPTPPQK